MKTDVQGLKRRFKLLPLAVAVSGILVLSGCSGPDWIRGEKTIELGTTLADLQPVALPNPGTVVPPISLSEIEGLYQRALAVADDPNVRRKILIRLAGLTMIRSENQQLAAAAPGEFFDQAANMYQELIELQRNYQREHGLSKSGNNLDQLQYQLAKAYALDGKVGKADKTLAQLAQENPQSIYLAEANFRRAEQAFSNGDYARAERLYTLVIAAGQTPFYSNSSYMLGWSYFKQRNYRQSLRPFVDVLDGFLVDEEGFDHLSASNQNMVQDTLRVMSLAFSYLESADTIAGLFESVGERPYVHLLYDQLATFYVEKKRYQDAADTLEYYIGRYPLSNFSPRFSARRIDIYETAGFPDLIIPAKQEFVQNYGIYSAYWLQKGDEIHKYFLPNLHSYLEQLATYEHAAAQAMSEQLAGAKKNAVNKDKLPSLADTQARYLKAAAWYQQFVDTFPADRQTAEMTYLWAEALYAGADFSQAFTRYEQVAYVHRSETNGAEAGYSALLAADRVIEELGANNDDVDKLAIGDWQHKKIQSALAFAKLYDKDPRAVAVLTQAAKDLLETGQLLQAADAADRVTRWQPQPELALRKTAWLVLAQAEFDLQNYAQAEQAYKGILGLMKKSDPERASIRERLAASIYQQADLHLRRGEKALAVADLLRIEQAAPGSDIARTGLYDAGNYLIDMQDWAQAENVVLTYRQRFPTHELTATLPAKLVVIYQAQEKWQAAAQELLSIAKSDSDPTVQRESRWLAATMYEKAGNMEKAIEFFRDYAHNYPEPMSDNLEAQYKMAGFYTQTKEQDKRNYWLRKLIKTHQTAAQPSSRSRYLAAYASADLAEQQYQVFKAITLSLPLKTSLKKKKQALQKTLAAYEQTLDFAVQEFTTQATYRIGEIYAQLSRDLMNSQRPKGLSELELEQYEILLEEQAYPFEEQAIDIHSRNTERSWQGVYDSWVKDSFDSLARLLPGRFAKKEMSAEVSDAIY